MKKFLSLFTMLAFLSVANVWGLDVTSTFTNDSWGVGSGEPTWTASSISVQAKVDKGVQVTLSNIKNASGFTLTNNTFKNTSGLDKITGITLNVSANGTGGSIAGVTVGGTAFKNGNSTSYNVSKSDGQTPSFTHATGVKGDIIISFSSTATSKSLYIKSITITYTTTSQSCTNKVTVTTVASGNGSFTVHQGTADGTEVANSGTVDNCGTGTTTLVVVPDADDNYYCSAVTASGSADVDEDEDGNWVITYNQGSAIATSISATFSAIPSYNVTWTANGGEHAKTSVKKGNRPTFPATPVSTDAKSKQFVGWATSTWDTPLDDVSSKTIYTYGDAMPAVNGEVEYFAVWAKSTDTYAIMEYGDELTDGNYVFAAYASSLDYAMGNSVSSNMIAGTYISVANDEIEEPNAQFIWKLSHIDGTYISLYNAAATTNHYLGLTSSGLTLEANPNTNGQFNPFLSNTSNLATIALKSKSQTGKEIQYYQGNFKSYTSQSNSKIYIYKEILEKYITTCASCNVSPSLGNPTLTSIASGKFTVECPNIGAGSAACEITDYGFIWKKGSAPTMESKDGIESTGTNDQSSAYSDDLTIDVANNTGSTYYIKAYATNGNGTTLSSALEVTPQSVTFNMNGHGSQVATQYVNNGGTATDPGTTSITGYTFNGWKLNSSAYSFSSAVTSDITLVADWSVKSHTLTWTTTGDALTGDYTGKSGKVDYGTTIVAPNTPTKTGYTFAAWSSAVATTMPDNDVTYTATWTAKTTAIMLNKNNEDAEGSNAGSASWTYDQTTKNSYSTATRTGYTVEGYYTAASGGTKILNADGSLAGNAITVDEVVYTNDGKWAYNGIELTLYAHWTANTYKVVFKANGGTGDDVEQIGFTYDESKTLTSLETIGFTAPEHKYFLGWNTNSSATTAAYEDEASVSNLSSTNNGSVNLYAIWKAHTYTNYRTLCCTPLAAPANIVVSVTGAATATVTWDAVADATGYEYKLGDGEWTTASVTGTETKTLSLSGLDGASDYTIYVRTNGDGDNCAEGTASAGTNFRTYSTVTAAENDPLMGTAKVSLNNSDWSTSVEAADGTTIYLQATPGSLYQFSSWATPASGTISSNQLTGWSGDVTVTANFVAKELTKLDTPTGMGLVGEPTATSATIKWNAVDHASGYEVVCAGATKGDITVTDGVASCPLTILTAGTTYYWTVKALGDGISFEDGDACASQSFTTDLKKPTAIEITHEPTLTEYLEGESFASAGMIVKVTYNTGEIESDYDDYTIDPSGALTLGTTYVTVTATKNGQSRSTTQTITVHKKYTLTFKNNGQTILTYNLKEGDAYNAKGNFPSAGVSCDNAEDGNKTFMGWSTAEINEKQADAPAEGYASPTDVMGTSNVILNAVWAKQTGSPITYTKTNTVSVNDIVVIAELDHKSEGYTGRELTGFHTNSYGLGADFNTTPAATKEWTVVEGYDGVGVAFKDGNNKYLYWNSGNTLDVNETLSANTSWTVTEDALNDRAKVLSNASPTNPAKERVLCWNYSSPRFATYEDKVHGLNGNAYFYYPVFYKKTGGISYTDYLTTCCDEWSVTASYGESNIINVGDDPLAVTLSDVAYGAASYESSDEAVLTVAADGKITGVKAGSATVTIAWAGIAGSKCAFETTVDVTVNGSITVTYNKNDGSETPATTSQDATSNTAFALNANTFSRTGYTFQGWATTPSSEKAYDDQETDVEFAESTTLYAVWVINSHAVTLTQPTGNEIKANNSTTPGNVNYGTTVTLTATENDGYVFTGWSVTGTTVVDANAKSTTFTMPDNVVTVTATYSTYTWDFVNYTVSPTPGTVYTDADQFDKSAYTVTANYERSDTKTPKAVDLAANAWTVKLNGTAIADDYEFAAGDDGKELAFYVNVDNAKLWSSDITVTEVDKDRFIDGLWGNTTIIKKEANYTVPTLTQTPGDAGTCDNHTVFIGWVLADDAENPTDGNKVVGGTTGQTPTNKTYYAIWAEHYSGNKDFDASKTSFVESEKNGASLNGDISYTTTQNGGTQGPAVVSGGILRLYRKNSGDNVGSYITISAASGVTISAVEFEVSSTNAVKYKAGAYSAGNMSDVAITDGKVTISELSATKFTLANADKDHQLDISSITVAYSKHVEEDRDYITDCDPRYDVEFLAGTGATGSYDKVTKKAGVEITLPDGSALSKDHHTFAGWYSAYYDVTYSESTSMTYTVPVDGDILEAQWTEDHHAFVTFKNGENTIGEPLKVYDGGVFNLLGAQEADGKAFIGWKWNGNKYKAGQQNQLMDDYAVDRTYTAVWMPVIDVATIASTDLSNGKWILVEKKSQLKAGDFIVIAAAEYDVAMSNHQKTNNRNEAAVTKNVDTLSYTSNVAPLFLQYDPENDYYAFYDRAYDTNNDGVTDGSGYLFSNNNLKTRENIEDFQGVWSISIANKKASIVAQGNNEERIMLYNPTGNGKLFTCYPSVSQKELAIYKWAKNISSDMNVSDVTNTDMVIVNDGSTLTIDEPTTLDNLIVEAGGKVSGSANLIVNDLTIKTSLGTISGDDNDGGKSGEISNSNITANGDVWIEIELTQASEASWGWYAFSVPFPVNTMNGVYYQNTPLQNEVGYAIMAYHEDERAAGKYAWKKYRETNLVPGMLYIITVGDTDYKTLRFKKAQGTDLIASNSVPVSYTTASGEGASGWNGVGNPNLQVSHQNDYTYLQFLDHDDNCFRARTAATTDLLVGTAFMVQVAEATENITIATGANSGEGNIALAPARAPKAIENTIFEVKLRNTDTGKTEDNLFFTAREDATNEYEIGRDVAKMSMGNAKCAQMWIPAYGTQLCAADFQLVNNQAEYPLTINTPKAGTYSISAQENENATIYLTQNGSIIWNLSMSACELDLAQGQNEGYGLKLVINAPAVVTGVDQIDAKAGAQKVIIDDHVYILRGGQMYDVNGKLVK